MRDRRRACLGNIVRAKFADRSVESKLLVFGVLDELSSWQNDVAPKRSHKKHASTYLLESVGVRVD